MTNHDHKKDDNDLTAYKILNMSLLQFMLLLGILGILMAVCVHYFF